MIKQKAPKDMTFEEGIAYSEKVFKDGKESGCYSDGSLFTFAEFFEFLHRRLKEPAPNPFTDDQLAWMREEQRNGYNYSAIDFDGEVRLFEKKPVKDCTHWNKITGSNSKSNGKGSALSKVLSVDDPEPLCFADYAPLEEKK